jgi:hypothetical protein
MNNDLSALTQSLRDFVKAREWEQFHSPKNLAVALSLEAAESLVQTTGAGRVVSVEGNRCFRVELVRQLTSVHN